MRRSAAIFALMAVAGSAGTVQAAVTVFGNTTARMCYESALYERASASNIRECTIALEDGHLSNRDRVATHVNRGILYVHSGDYVRGIADYDRAIELDETEPDAYLNKALVLLHNESDLQQVVELLTTAIRYGTREPALAYYGRGIANELNGDIPAAYYDIRHAADLDPEWDLPAQELRRFQVVGGEG